MVPTLVLDEMVRVAGVYGSKIALIGDFAQMGAPEAGGLLRDLAALPSAVELTAVRRFRQPWEADASLQLRARKPDVAATYQHEAGSSSRAPTPCSTTSPRRWWADTAQGHRALIVVDTGDDAADVNTRCQQHLMVDGRLGDHVADTADGCRIHIGDLIQTRRNTSDIITSDHRRILNRDVWTVTAIGADGSLHVDHALRSASAVLPARLRRRRRRAGLRHHHRRRPGPHRRPGPRRRHPPHHLRIALRRHDPRPRHQPRPRRVRQPRPHRVRARRPHRRTSLRRRHPTRTRRPALRPHRPATLGRRTRRPHHRPRRRPQPPTDHRLVDRSVSSPSRRPCRPRSPPDTTRSSTSFTGSPTRPAATPPSAPRPPRSTGAAPAPPTASSDGSGAAAAATPVPTTTAAPPRAHRSPRALGRRAPNVRHPLRR